MPMTDEESTQLLRELTNPQTPGAIGCPLHLTDPLSAFRAGLETYAVALRSRVTLDKPDPTPPDKKDDGKGKP